MLIGAVGNAVAAGVESFALGIDDEVVVVQYVVAYQAQIGPTRQCTLGAARGRHNHVVQLVEQLERRGPEVDGGAAASHAHVGKVALGLGLAAQVEFSPGLIGEHHRAATAQIKPECAFHALQRVDDELAVHINTAVGKVGRQPGVALEHRGREAVELEQVASGIVHHQGLDQHGIVAYHAVGIATQNLTQPNDGCDGLAIVHTAHFQPQRVDDDRYRLRIAVAGTAHPGHALAQRQLAQRREAHVVLVEIQAVGARVVDERHRDGVGHRRLNVEVRVEDKGNCPGGDLGHRAQRR